MPGFLFLHSLFIERGRLETVWQVKLPGMGKYLRAVMQSTVQIPAPSSSASHCMSRCKRFACCGAGVAEIWLRPGPAPAPRHRAAVSQLCSHS